MSRMLFRGLQATVAIALVGLAAGCATAPGAQRQVSSAASQPRAMSDLSVTAIAPPPAPQTSTGHPVNWWFAFKFNAKAFPLCGAGQTENCLFGGSPSTNSAGQQFVTANSESGQLVKGDTCLGQTLQDPIGATFNEVYNGSLFYVLWNDQFYDDPTIPGCTQECSAPWAHSKGMVAWDANGNGFLMQVTTPSWPGSGSQTNPRAAGNTLACVSNDNNMKFSQHFFSLRLTKNDLVKVLTALGNASVATDPSNRQIVSNGGPSDVQSLVAALGKQSASTQVSVDTLSTGVEMIAKPSRLNVPPWQMVSALLGGQPLKVANWWTTPDKIPATTAGTPIHCWDASLGTPGAVESATSGTWDGVKFGLQGGASADHNHAKVAVGTAAGSDLVIFGDMNEQGSLSGNCKAAQNGRGGLFFVVHDAALNQAMTSLMDGP
ncbi:MAG TPA: deoxyribonuclease II family protein [Dyella sp.]|uniref:deoxyribonuclease II family protein n=1 Tax=Dyella sp. TaxID=1869338 RepID=UPI002F93589C